MKYSTINQHHATRFLYYILIVASIMFSTQVLPDEKWHIQVTTMDIEPFGYISSNGEPAGIFPELTNYLAQEVGFDFENRVVPYARTMIEIESKNADLLMIYPNEVIDRVGIRVDPALRLTNVVISRSGIEIDSLAALRGWLVASVRGAKYADLFSASGGIIKYDTYDYYQNIKMLFLGRVDAIVGAKEGIYRIASGIGYSPDNFGTPLTLNSQEAYLYLAKMKHSNLFAKELRKVLRSDKYRAFAANILREYSREQ